MVFLETAHSESVVCQLSTTALAPQELLAFKVVTDWFLGCGAEILIVHIHAFSYMRGCYRGSILQQEAVKGFSDLVWKWHLLHVVFSGSAAVVATEKMTWLVSVQKWI